MEWAEFAAVHGQDAGRMRWPTACKLGEQMRPAARFERTEQYGTLMPDAGSGIRVRPDMAAMAEPADTARRTAIIAPVKQTQHTATARLPPFVRESWSPPPSLSAPARTQPLTAPIARIALVAAAAPVATIAPVRTSSRPPMHASARPSAPPPAVPIHPAVHAALHAAVHASVQASVQSVLASAHLWRPPQATPAPFAPLAANPFGDDTLDTAVLAPAWTPAQRVYVLATAVTLAVLITLLANVALGGSAIGTATVGARSARIAAISTETSVPTVGSASGKDVSFVAADATQVTQPAQAAARRAHVPAARTTASGGAGSAGGTSSSAKLDDAARSAKMLRDQLATAVN